MFIYIGYCANTLAVSTGSNRRTHPQVTEGMLKETSESFNYNFLDDIVKFYLNEASYNQFDKIKIEFGGVKYTLAGLLKKKVQPSNLKDYLKYCHPEWKPELSIADDTIDSIMDIINDRCTIINFEVIKSIVKRYNITEAEEIIQQYEVALDQFCTDVSLKVLLNKQFLKFEFLTCETIVFIVNWKADETTLNDIRRLLEKAFTYMEKRVVIKSICEGHSILITCYAPHYLMDMLYMEAQENIEELRAMGLMKLTISYYTVYDDTKDKVITIMLV